MSGIAHLRVNKTFLVGGIIMAVTPSQCLLVVDNISTVDWSMIDCDIN